MVVFTLGTGGNVSSRDKASRDLPSRASVASFERVDDLQRGGQ
jgi:hypothetical protein